MKKHVIGLFLSSAALILTACGGGDNSSSSASSIASSGSSASSSEEATYVAPTWENKNDPANGLQTYVKADYDKRTELLGKLEEWAVFHKLTGLTLYGDGGYVMYDTSVSKGTNNYIPGYGFGILTEGELTADLSGESNAAYKRYYHTFETDDPGKINYMDDKGSVVGDLIGYVSDGYFGNFMNDTKDGYNWVPSLSSQNRPVAINADDDGYSTTYRIYVKTGNAVKYATSSAIAKYAAFNGRPVALEDYVTPYKIYYTQSYGMARGSENLDGAGSIKGSAAYYAASANGYSDKAWEGIGIKTGSDDSKGDYLEFTFNQPCNRFYAMYYLSSSMFAPVPAEFIQLLGDGDFAAGTKNWGVGSDNGETIADHWLCTGPYMFERWDASQQIVFKKNPFYTERDPDHYKIAGVHVNIFPAAKEDQEAAFNEFLAGKLHAVSIPATKLEQYKTDPRTTTTKDSSTYKLNLNTCDQETWEELFGTEGSITKTEVENYWECEPAMNNKTFVDGLSFALDRATIASVCGRTPSGNYFGNGYMSNPEDGIRYNDTEAHKKAVADIMEGTVDGYSLEKAKAAFKQASKELIAGGFYRAGDTIDIEVAWQTEAQKQREHGLIKKMFEDAFNIDGNPLRLNVVDYVPAVWSDVYYKKMMVGQFDIGFGSVSGNTLDPINFLEVLKSDNSSGFTLNWGIDTDDINGDLIDFDGKAWTFDALWKAADQGAAVKNGGIDQDFGPLFAVNPASVDLARNGDSSVTISFDVHEETVMLDESNVGAFGMFYGICIFGCSDTEKYTDYEESYLILGDEGLVVTDTEDAYWNVHVSATFDAETVEYYNAFTGVCGFDVYEYDYFLGNTSASFYATVAQVRPGSLIQAAA